MFKIFGCFIIGVKLQLQRFVVGLNPLSHLWYIHANVSLSVCSYDSSIKLNFKANCGSETTARRILVTSQMFRIINASTLHVASS